MAAFVFDKCIYGDIFLIPSHLDGKSQLSFT